MIPDLDSADIKRCCGASTYQRGLAYFEQGKVLGVKLDEYSGVPQIKASVAGRDGRIYEVNVEIRRYDDDYLEIDGDCSCAAQIDCKHVAATLMYVVHNDDKQEPKEEHDGTSDWLERMKKASRTVLPEKTERFPEDISQRLLYILEPQSETQNGWGVEVSTQRVRKLKKGGYGKASNFPLEKAREGTYSTDFIQQVDRDIAQLLTTKQEFYYYNFSNAYPLRREIGELALHKMLLSGRCHWIDKDAPPLRLANARHIQFEWQPTGDQQTLTHKIDPPARHLFRSNNFWYLDLDKQEAGPIQHTSLTPNQIEALLDAPPIPAEKMEAVSQQLLLETPEYDLPIPVGLDLEEITIKGEQPILQLRLLSRKAGHSNEGAQASHCAALSFLYGPIKMQTLGMHRVARSVHDGTLYRVERELDAEQIALDTLFELGLRLEEDSTSKQTLDWFFPTESSEDTAWHWHHFMEDTISQLQKQGWRIDIDSSFDLRFDEADEWHAELEEQPNQWFSLTLGVDIDGKRINLLPILVDILSRAGSSEQLRALLDSQPHFLAPVGHHHWLKISSSRIKPMLDTLVELYDQEPLDKEGALTFSRPQSVQISELLNDPKLTWHGAEELQRLNTLLSNFKGIASIPLPQGFNADLRDYQHDGLNWLQFLREFEFNGILADDMGLGKTVQTLAHLLKEKQDGRMTHPCLIIAPTSLMGNWRREAERFAPELKVLVLHGNDRHFHFHRITEHNVILTTYPLLRRDKELLLSHQFHYVVLDEAQFIKNPKSQTTQIVFELKSQHRLCLTGTPMENHLGELWSMFHFLMPGYLGNLKRFTRLFRTPIERQGDDIRSEQLRRRIKPFLLRRSKADVAAELPKKTEIIRAVSLQGEQRDLYESIRLAMDKQVRDEISRKGLARSHIMILDALLKLRQVCCDPRLVSLPQARSVQQSAKLELLMDLVPEMVEEGRKILIFSQFTTMLELIENALSEHHIEYSKLTGKTRDRDTQIDQFQQGDKPVFLISLKAGGVGLNLTAADTVIHYDPWWNPAVENQATDRAHRIGQDKAVFVYKLITEQTVEEKIIALQEKKQQLAESVYSDSAKGGSAAFSADELSELFQPLDE
jgi:SNF2 family DNA or RNA helicase